VHDFTNINTQIHRDRKYNRRLIKSIIELPGTEGRENGKLLFHGYRASIWDD